MSSLSKIVITGKVVRNPEKRFKDNSFPITSFTINIGINNEEKLVKVLSFGKLAETTADILKKGQTVIVEGKLQTGTVKTDSGAEKKVVEINAQAIEVIGTSEGSQEASDSSDSDTTDFDFTEDSNDELIGEDEIPF